MFLALGTGIFIVTCSSSEQLEFRVLNQENRGLNAVLPCQIFGKLIHSTWLQSTQLYICL